MSSEYQERRVGLVWSGVSKTVPPVSHCGTFTSAWTDKEVTPQDIEKIRKHPLLGKHPIFTTWNETDQALYDLAQQYHERCDAYDQRHCTGKSPRAGEPLPANGNELGAINANAKEVHEDIVRQGHFMGFTPRQIEDAIREYEGKRHA